MRIANTFDVAAPRDVAWRLLNDVPTVLPCMPGAELVETISASSWKAKLHVKLGPIALQFAADVTRTEMDETAGRAVLLVKAREARGRGSAEARIESMVSDAADAGTRVDLVTELELRGAVAQYGRGVVDDIARRLTDEFARCLARHLTPGEPAGLDANASTSTRRGEVDALKPINGLTLALRALVRRITSRFSR